MTTPVNAQPATQPSAYRRMRRTLGRWRRSVADPNHLAARMDRQRAQLDRQTRELNDLKSKVESLRKRLHPVELASRHRAVEHANLAIQVGVWEERLGALQELVRGDSYVGSDAEVSQARSLVEEIRREHAQVRVRMQVIAQYEERLRRLESAFVELHEGDVRHPF